MIEGTSMTWVAIAAIVYRIITIGFGFGFAFLGYRLFSQGMTKNAGELRAAFGDKGLLLKQVAPGIWFAFFGTAITCFSVYRGVDVATEASAGVANIAVKTGSGSDTGPPASAPTPADRSVAGQLLGIDPTLDLDNYPKRMQTILDKLQGGEQLDNQEKELLKVYMGKLKARVTAQQGGTKS
jgi:hypothetical protein